MRKCWMSALLALATVSCGVNDDGPSSRLVLGAVIDQTGNNSELSWLQAVRLATKQMNAALEAEGYPLNFRFRLASADSENDVNGGPDSRAIRRITEVVRDEGAAAVVIDSTQVSEEAAKLPYDADPSNDLPVPMQCSSCTGGSLLNATATDPDPVTQAARRNSQLWLTRTTMASTVLATITVRRMLEDYAITGGRAPGDSLKVAIYANTDSFGTAAANAVVTQLNTQVPADLLPRLKIERRNHENLNDITQIPFKSDMEALVNDFNEATGEQDGPPDYITIATFGRNAMACVDFYKRLERTTGGPGSLPPIHHFHNFRLQNNLVTLGELAEGQFGVSHIILEGAAGARFATDFQADTGLAPVYRDSIYYDNAATLLLGSFIAMVQTGATAETLEPSAIREFLRCTSAPAARSYTSICPGTETTFGATVTPGIDGFRTGIRAILASQPIDYSGASGPVDYDRLGNVVQQVAAYEVIDGQYRDIAKYDCLASPTCPQIE